MANCKGECFSFDDEAYYGILSHHSDHRRDCAYCGAPMTSSDVNDYGSLCRACYMQEYYGGDNSY